MVFVTAYDRYARRGLRARRRGLRAEARAQVERLARHRAAPQGAPGRAGRRSWTALVGELARRIAPGAERLQWLQASLGNTLKLINVDDVLYFQSDTKYTRVVTRDAEALVKKTLRELAAELDPRHFWQVHRGTIVNIRAIASVTSDDSAGARSRCATGPRSSR